MHQCIFTRAVFETLTISVEICFFPDVGLDILLGWIAMRACITISLLALTVLSAGSLCEQFGPRS